MSVDPGIELRVRVRVRVCVGVGFRARPLWGDARGKVATRALATIRFELGLGSAHMSVMHTPLPCVPYGPSIRIELGPESGLGFEVWGKVMVRASVAVEPLGPHP